ncbi:hypothetical protein TRVL_06856 [Trypanosoma vivax]|nr:hypothetical protein TRVL_06856 [Trypanosoma vivax]
MYGAIHFPVAACLSLCKFTYLTPAHTTASMEMPAWPCSHKAVLNNRRRDYVKSEAKTKGSGSMKYYLLTKLHCFPPAQVLTKSHRLPERTQTHRRKWREHCEANTHI